MYVELPSELQRKLARSSFVRGSFAINASTFNVCQAGMKVQNAKQRMNLHMQFAMVLSRVYS